MSSLQSMISPTSEEPMIIEEQISLQSREGAPAPDVANDDLNGWDFSGYLAPLVSLLTSALSVYEQTEILFALLLFTKPGQQTERQDDDMAARLGLLAKQFLESTVPHERYVTPDRCDDTMWDQWECLNDAIASSVLTASFSFNADLVRRSIFFFALNREIRRAEARGSKYVMPSYLADKWAIKAVDTEGIRPWGWSSVESSRTPIEKFIHTKVDEIINSVADLFDPRLNYRDYLASDEWHVKADAAKERAGRRCQVCNSQGPLDCHHRTYERIGDEHPDDLTVLCRPCHELFSKNGRLAKP